MVTNVAITKIKAAILTLSGIRFLSKAIKRLEKRRTNVVAAPIPMPFIAAVVIASVGQVPNTITNVGFSLSSPLVKYLMFPIIAGNYNVLID
jgi:uncharacterized membrane protein